MFIAFAPPMPPPWEPGPEKPAGRTWLLFLALAVLGVAIHYGWPEIRGAPAGEAPRAILPGAPRPEAEED